MINTSLHYLLSYIILASPEKYLFLLIINYIHYICRHFHFKQFSAFQGILQPSTSATLRLDALFSHITYPIKYNLPNYGSQLVWPFYS